MTGTKWARNTLGELQEVFPDIRGGLCNCRLIAGTHTYSQHAWCNALDLHHKDYGYSAVAAHQAYLDKVHRWLSTYLDELSIRTMLWRKRDHFDHIHIDGWPKAINLPPCKGATVSWWQNPDGSKFTLGKYQSPDPVNGYIELPDRDLIVIEEENMLTKGDAGFEVAVHQAALVALGYEMGSWAPYSGDVPIWFTGEFPVGADGAYGQATTEAVLAFQQASSLQMTGNIDGITSSMLLTFGNTTPEHTHPLIDHTHSATIGGIK